MATNSTKTPHAETTGKGAGHGDTNAKLASVFAALGDNSRLKLLDRLQDQGTQPLRDLAQTLPISRQGVSKHLRQMVAAGVVVTQKVGRETHYSYNAQGIAAAQAYLARASAQWDAALHRLSRHLDETQ